MVTMKRTAMHRNHSQTVMSMTMNDLQKDDAHENQHLHVRQKRLSPSRHHGRRYLPTARRHSRKMDVENRAASIHSQSNQIQKLEARGDLAQIPMLPNQRQKF